MHNSQSNSLVTFLKFTALLHYIYILLVEPDIYKVKFNTSINGTQLGHEFIKMVDLVHSFGDCYKTSYFVGPDIATLHINAEEIAKE